MIRRNFLRVFISVLVTLVVVVSGLPAQGLAYAASLVEGASGDQTHMPSDSSSTEKKSDSEMGVTSVSETVSVQGSSDGGEGLQSDTSVVSTEQGSGHDHAHDATETIMFAFVVNAPQGVGVVGEMQPLKIGTDGSFSLPANRFSCDGHEFVGWSLTVDGKAVEDDASTPDVDESVEALSLPDGATVSEMTYVEHGASGDVVHDLRRVLHDGVITLYAQWKATPAESLTSEDGKSSDASADGVGSGTADASSGTSVSKNEDASGSVISGVDTTASSSDVTESPKKVVESDVSNERDSGDEAPNDGTVAPGGTLGHTLGLDKGVAGVSATSSSLPRLGNKLLGGTSGGLRSASPYVITFNAGDGHFDGGGSTNVINLVPEDVEVTKVSHTPNIDDAGNKLSNYGTYLDLNDVVTIEGASELTVNIQYGGQGTSYDWACVWSGSHPTYSAYYSYSSSVSGKLGGSNSSRTYTISDSSVTFGFRSDYSGYGSGFGYYATVTGVHTEYVANGTYATPVSSSSDMRFIGWFDSNGVRVDDWQSLRESTTLTARYADNRVSFDANSGSGSMPDLLLESGSKVPPSTFVAPAANMAFCGWNTDPNGGGTAYAPGDSLVVDAGSYTLYAQWLLVKPCAVLDLNGKLTVCMASASVTSSTYATVVDIDGNSYTGRVFVNFGADEGYTYVPFDPFSPYNSSIKSVSFAQRISPVYMGGWFNGCYNLTSFDSTNLDMSRVVNTSRMFYGCRNAAFNPDVSNWDMSSVTNMDSMFYGCSGAAFNPDVSNWDMSSVTNMDSMFNGCSGAAFSPNLSHWNTPQLQSARRVFAGCTGVTTLDLSSFDCRNVTSMEDFFPNSIAQITLGENFHFVDEIISVIITPGSQTGDMWANVTTGGNSMSAADLARNYDGSQTSGDYARGTYALQSRGSTYAVLTDDGDFVFLNSFEEPVSVDGSSSRFSVTDVNGVTWTGQLYRDVETSGRNWSSLSAKRVYVAEGSMCVPSSMNSWFSSFTNLESVDFSGFDTSSVTNFSGLFNGCSKLKYVNLNELDTSSATNMSYMFHACSSLETIDVSNLSTRMATSMSNMFGNCSSLTEIIGIDTFNTTSLTDISNMFYYCSSLRSLDLSRWNVRRVDFGSHAFLGTGGVVDVSNWYGPYIEPSDLFYASFLETSAIIGRNMDIGQYASSDRDFYFGDGSCTEIDFSGSTFQHVTGLSISGSSNLKSLNLSGLSLPQCTDLLVASNGGLEYLGVNGMSLPVATGMSFPDNRKLKSIHITSLDAPALASVSGLLHSCWSLTSADLSGLDGSPLTSMISMFEGCASLKFLNVAGIDTSNVTNMSGLFYDCSDLRSIDLRTWDTHNVTTMDNMFGNCKRLERLGLGSDFVFVGDDSLPVQSWDNLDTGAFVGDLWHDYDGATMAGMYGRAVSVIDKNDVYTDDKNVEYDASSGAVTVYLKSEENATPGHVMFPLIKNQLRIRSSILDGNSSLKSRLSGIIEDGQSVGDLSVSVKVVSYVDVSFCSREDKTLLTFDVPTSDPMPVHIDLYRQIRNGLIYTYDGYIENDANDLTKFYVYSANGELLDTLLPNQRHTLAQLYGFTGDYPSSLYDVPAFPAYNEYLTYNPDMSNYEVLVDPARYKMVFSTPGHDDLAVSGVSEVKENGSTFYQMDINRSDSFSKPVSLTVFNEIESVEYDNVIPGRASIGMFRKVNQLSPSKGVAGATYRFTGLSSGEVMYGRTDEDGYIRPCLGASGNSSSGTIISYASSCLYRSLSGDGTLSDPCRPTVDETYLVEEVLPPDDFYLNSETTTVTFVSSILNPVYVGKANTVRRDGTTIRYDQTVEPKGRKCLTCTPEYMCMCSYESVMFGPTCDHCGTPGDRVRVSLFDSLHSDVPYPSINAAKVDDFGHDLSGARLQVLHGGQVVDDWVSNGSSHSFVFPETGAHGIAYGQSDESFVLHEVSTSGDGYLISEDIPFTVSYDSGNISLRMVDREATGLSVTKAWSPAPPSGGTATFALLADGVPTGDTVTLDGVVDDRGESSPWVATFSGLPKYKRVALSEIAYTVSETDSSVGWSPANAEPVSNQGTITNIRRISMPTTGGHNDNGLIALACLATVGLGGVATVLRRRHRDG